MSALRRNLNPGARGFLAVAERVAVAQGLELWLVGGAVRDLVLGRPVFDLDLAVDRAPARFARRVARESGGKAEVYPGFGTATVEAAGLQIDVARFRRERYEHPGALPSVRPTRFIEDDLRRRDFSVNAMALALAGPRRGAVADPTGGYDDLRAGRLRVLHERSFEDDATRLWRGARTAALFALRPEPDTARLIARGTQWVATISGERLWAQFRYTARRGAAGATFATLEDWGVLAAIAPGFTFDTRAARALARRPRPLPVERLAAVVLAPLAARRAILDRFEAPRDARRAVDDAARLLAAEGDDPDVLVRLERAVEDARLAALWLGGEPQARLRDALVRWERTEPVLEAADLTALGVTRGPALGAALRFLRRARYLGTLTEPEEARRAVRRRLAAGEGW